MHNEVRGCAEILPWWFIFGFVLKCSCIFHTEPGKRWSSRRSYVWNHERQLTYFWIDLCFWMKYYILKKEEITSKQIYAWICETLLTCIIGRIVSIINSLADLFSFVWCPTSGQVMLRLRIIHLTSRKSMWKWINNFQVEKGIIFPESITLSEIENEKVYYCLLFWTCLLSIMPSWNCFKVYIKSSFQWNYLQIDETIV